MKRSLLMVSAILIYIVILSACSKEEMSNSSDTSIPKREQLISQKWEPVSRGYRVQGNVVEVDISEDGQLISLSLNVTKNMKMENNPVDYDFVGKTIDLFIKGENLDTKATSKLKEGTNLAIAFAQHAIQDGSQYGKVFYGAVPEWVYFVENEKYMDIEGETIIEDALKP